MTDRTTDTAVHRQFLDRWSPRAMDGSTLSDGDLRTLLEAARWAPSAYNAQPWIILHARPGDAWFDRFLAGLVPANQVWAKSASLLVYYLSDTLLRGDDPAKAAPSHTHSFDTGSAWMSMALQAHHLGLIAHGMSGVEWDKVRADLDVPDRWRIEAAAAFGRRASPDTLPEKLRDGEVPSGRKPIEEIAFAGGFPDRNN